jgi:hypothetical protein
MVWSLSLSIHWLKKPCVAKASAMNQQQLSSSRRRWLAVDYFFTGKAFPVWNQLDYVDDSIQIIEFRETIIGLTLERDFPLHHQKT